MHLGQRIEDRVEEALPSPTARDLLAYLSNGRGRNEGIRKGDVSTGERRTPLSLFSICEAACQQWIGHEEVCCLPAKEALLKTLFCKGLVSLSVLSHSVGELCHMFIVRADLNLS